MYYLLNVITINIPPLRERKDDIPPLISHFLKTYQEKFDKMIDGITEDVHMIFCLIIIGRVT